MDWRGYVSKWRQDYNFKTFLNSFGSMTITLIFSLYNGYLGLVHASSWHGSISVYYLLLTVLRGCMILGEKESAGQAQRKGGKSDDLRLKVYLLCSGLLLISNLCMIGPIALLVRQRRPVSMTMIPAIAMAAYSFYKITLASVNLVRRKKSANCLVRLLRAVNFIDALMSIVTLQNTLVMVATKGDKLTLLPLTATTSGLVWLAIVLLSVSSLVWGVRAYRSRHQK